MNCVLWSCRVTCREPEHGGDGLLEVPVPRLFVLGHGDTGWLQGGAILWRAPGLPSLPVWLKGRGRGVAREHPQVPAQPLSSSARCWQLWPEAD